MSEPQPREAPRSSHALVPVGAADDAAIPARWPLWLIATLPRHLLSHLAGAFARYRFPPALQQRLNRGYVRSFGVDASEAEFGVGSYPSIQALFTRRLREGARPVDESVGSLVSPVDGAWGEAGLADGDRAIQVKGRDYSLRALLGGGTRAEAFVGGSFATFYLSPRDYHRIHSPVDGEVRTALYLPGSLWPVNQRAVHHVADLFARNERLVLFFDAPAGPVALVAVGATMVGRTVLVFDDLHTNARARRRDERSYDGVPFRRGQELARFEFGSTVVLVLGPGVGTFDVASPGTPLRMGERVGGLSTTERAS
ncbi:MAG: archaetidylserine decarboxylase [Pseudomonadota bacterium]